MLGPKKLNSRGASHIVALMLVIVISGIVGSYLLIKSHADSLIGYIATVKTDGIYISDADGKNPHLLPGTASSFDAVSFNRTGTTLAFTKGNNIFTIDSNGLNLKQVTNDAMPIYDFHPSWSSDGTKIVYSHVDSSQPNNNSSGTINVINNDGTNQTVITSGPTDSNPLWSADGSKILYLTYDNLSSAGPRWMTVSPDGTNPVVLANTPSYAYDAAWSPDGQSIAFVDGGGLYSAYGTTVGSGEGNGVFTGCGVEKYDMTTQQSTTVFKYANFQCGGIPWSSAVSWSPDGQSIAFNMFPVTPESDSGGGSRGTDGSIYTIASGGGSLHNLQNEGAYGVSWGAVPPITYTATCSITNVPSVLQNGTNLTPSISVTNTGTAPITPSMKAYVGIKGMANSNFNELVMPQIAPGATLTQPLGSYTAKLKATGSAIVSANSDLSSADTKADFACNTPFTINVPLTYVATCSLIDIPNSVKKGSSFSPSVTIKNTGSGLFDANINSYVNPNGGASTNLKSFSVTNLAPGVSKTRLLGTYSVAKTSKATKGVVYAKDTDVKTGFSCSKSFTIK